MHTDIENPITEKSSKTLEVEDIFAREKKGQPVVEIREINYSYGHGENKIQVLFNNNLAIYPGDIVIMTGPSGSGKTTLLTLIGALRSVQEGSLKVTGRELYGLIHSEQVKVRRSIGFIFQAHNLFESLTAYQNVKMATELIHHSESDLKGLPVQILEGLELGDHIHKRPHNLSGGQRQRVAIGRALVNRPKLILADEPTAALDKDTGRLVVNILHNLAKTEGCAVMIVTHDNRILDVADRIVRMVDGYIESDVDVAESVTIAKFLKRCPVFKDSDPSLLADISNSMHRETHPAGAIIIKQGDVGDKFYIIRSGRVGVIKETDGKAETVEELSTGDFFGELALLRKELRAATIKAIDEVEVLILSKEIFMDVVEKSHTFEECLRSAYFTK